MVDTDEDTDEGTVVDRMDDLDEESAPVKTYECNDCGYRTSATHQPGECPRCGGEMLDVSVSRE